MIGERFGRWLVLRDAAPGKARQRRYMCRCDCGAESICTAGNLKRGISKSCGCLKSELTSARRLRHGRNGKDPTYGTWSAMRTRCSNPRSHHYDRYGGRGIRVCERWDSFENFLADMGERPVGKTLDRWPDKDGDYKPDNCRWATQAEQRRNNSSPLRSITAFGETKILTDWARERGIRALVIWKRLARGWSPERALTEPVRKAA